MSKSVGSLSNKKMKLSVGFMKNE